ncbi:MAG: 30S ribosomal protein S20 [Anaerolineales bacterium]
MANTRSAKKRIRQTERRRLRNRPILARVRSYLKRAQTVDTVSDPDAARRTVLAAIQELDRAASKGILHKNNVARRKSRLLRRLNQPQA